jgi:hypothetical protein
VYLSLNVSIKPLNPLLLKGFVGVGALLQTAVLGYAAVSQYYLKLGKNEKPAVTYGFWVSLARTISLASGMFGCAMVV